MKKVLITGARGFIGSHLTRILLNNGYEVVAIYHSNNKNQLSPTEPQLINNLKIVVGDVTDRLFCNKICENIDTIFHLAGLGGIPNSFKFPDKYIHTNIIGTLNICNASLNNNVKRLIYTSTCDVYGDMKYFPTNEEHPLLAKSPYSASKIGAESVAMSYYHAYKLPLTIVRPFNTYGPGQSLNAIIPTIINQILSDKKQIKLGDVSPTRDFSYVTDTCRALVLLENCKEAIGETVNIGSNIETKILDIFVLIKKLMQSNVEYITDAAKIRLSGSEISRGWCDNTKIKSLTQYEPRVSLIEGLQKTIDWYQRNRIS